MLKSGTDINRLFTPARKAQGFHSQAHLDAFLAAYDHRSSCADCKARDGFVLLDDGYQSTTGSCPVARQLDAETARVS